MTSQELKDFAINVVGVDAIGIAPIERFVTAPEYMNPKTVFPGAKSVIVFARRILRGCYRGIEQGTHWPSYQVFAYSGLTKLVHQANYRPYFERALKVRSDILPTGDDSCMNTMGWISYCHLYMQDYDAAEKALEEGKNFLFVYTASLDGLLHDQIGNPPAIREKLSGIRQQIGSLYRKAREYAPEVHFSVISDHGMTPLTGTVDVMKEIEQSGLVFGKDYGACYDSTMSRFHYLNEKAKEVIPEIMKKFPGHFLCKEEEIRYGIYRTDRMFGDAIFLLNAGIQIVPSDMGGKPLNGMHGFAPEDEHSFAVILSNSPIPEKVKNVSDYFNFMTERAEQL